MPKKARNPFKKFINKIRKDPAEKLVDFARAGDSDKVASILKTEKVKMEIFQKLLQPKWWGEGDVKQLEIGVKLLVDLSNKLPPESKYRGGLLPVWLTPS